MLDIIGVISLWLESLQNILRFIFAVLIDINKKFVPIENAKYSMALDSLYVG